MTVASERKRYLSEEIEQLRSRLNFLIQNCNFTDPEVVALGAQLDQLVIQYLKLDLPGSGAASRACIKKRRVRKSKYHLQDL